MSEQHELDHVAEIAGALQRRWDFGLDELTANRGRNSYPAAVALDRAMRLAPAALGRVLCALPEALRWVDYRKVWPTESAMADRNGDEVTKLRLKVAIILLHAMGAPLGVYSGEGWGEARTTYKATSV